MFRILIYYFKTADKQSRPVRAEEVVLAKAELYAIGADLILAGPKHALVQGHVVDELVHAQIPVLVQAGQRVAEEKF